MRTLLLTVSVIVVLGQACAQKMSSKDVPINIKNALQQKYDVSNADWDKEDEGFEASFKQKGKEVSVLFDATGEIREVENEIGKNELPQYVLDIISKDFAGFKIEEAAKIESKGIISYEAEVEKGKLSFELIFDGEKLFKKIAEEETEDKD